MPSTEQRKATSQNPTSENRGSDTPKSIRLSVNMNPETAEALKEIAEKNHISVTEAVRRAVSLAHFIEEQAREGKSIQIEDPKSKKVRELILM